MSVNLADDGAKGAAAQSFLKSPERLFRRTGSHQEKPRRIEAEDPQSRPIKIAAFAPGSRLNDPKERPVPCLKPGKQSRAKTGKRPGGAALPDAHLMQSGPDQPAAERPVHFGHAKGEAIGRLLACYGILKRRDCHAPFQKRDPPPDFAQPIRRSMRRTHDRSPKA